MTFKIHCQKSSSVSSFRTYATFSFTASTDSNLIPFNACKDILNATENYPNQLERITACDESWLVFFLLVIINGSANSLKSSNDRIKIQSNDDCIFRYSEKCAFTEFLKVKLLINITFQLNFAKEYGKMEPNVERLVMGSLPRPAHSTM